jgi:TM2 domain-containing membrane protein YozV
LSLICPYCRSEVQDAAGDRKDCPGCGTPHHADCFAENGGCTVFGCSAAPADEAKVTVTGTDLMGNVVTRQVTPPVSRPAVSLGAGFTTFHAPVPQPAAPAAEAPAPFEPAVPPPPPPMAGTGVAPPPQVEGPAPGAYAAGPLVNDYSAAQPKTRVVFVLLGVFLGVFGVHNFYTGYVKKGTIQLCLTLLTCFYGAAVSWIWAIVEICVVNQDAEGTQFV